MTTREILLAILLIASLLTIAAQSNYNESQKRATYKKGVRFGHRCVNASIAASNDKIWASESFRLQAASFADFGWECNPKESLLLQEDKR